MSQELTVQELYDALGDAIAKGYADEPIKLNTPVDLMVVVGCDFDDAYGVLVTAN